MVSLVDDIYDDCRVNPISLTAADPSFKLADLDYPH